LNFGCRTRVLFKGAGFLNLDSLFPLADSDPFFLRALRVAHGEKTRTLHKNREECGTQSWTELTQLRVRSEEVEYQKLIGEPAAHPTPGK
jgi:hypothetical protein